MVTLLNSSTLSGVVNLPLTTDIPFRSIMFKDFNGYTSGTSSITLSTMGSDTFENGSNTYVLSNVFESVKFYADTYHNKWITLSTYNPSKYVQWEPQTIKFVFPAPIIDWDTTISDSGLGIYWFPVEGATSYKIFGKPQYKNYLNKYTINDETILNKSLTAPFFDYDSGPITDSNNFNIDTSMLGYNFFVFAYNGDTRSDIPTTQLYYNYDSTGGLELWPVIEEEFYGGSNWVNGFTQVKVTNRYTGESITGSSNDFNPNPLTSNNFPNNLSEIHINVPISNK